MVPKEGLLTLRVNKLHEVRVCYLVAFDFWEVVWSFLAPLVMRLWLWFFRNHADLKTMSKRVESEQYYVTFEMFVADARRMFANARTYNSPETIYYKCASRHGALTLSITFLPFFSSKSLYSCTHRKKKMTSSNFWMLDVQAGSPFLEQSSIGSPIGYQDPALIYSCI